MQTAEASVDGEPTQAPFSGVSSREPDELGIAAAAQAAQKCLFFVELLRGNCIRQRLSATSPRMTRAAVGLRERVEQRWGKSPLALRLHFEGDEAHCRQQIARLVRTVPSGSVEPRLRSQWQRIEELAGAQRSLENEPAASERREQLARAEAAELDRALSSFLQAAFPPARRHAQNAVELLRRNLASLAGVGAVVSVLFLVEQVRALLLDITHGVLIAASILLPGPAFLLIGWLLRRHRPASDSALGQWAQTNLFWRASARHPRGYDVFAARSGITLQLLVVTLSKSFVAASWLGLAAFALAVLPVPNVLQTIGWTVCLLGAGGIGAALLDFWDFIHPAPVRLVFLTVAAYLGWLYTTVPFGLALGTLAMLPAVVAGGMLFRRPRGWRSLSSVLGGMGVIAVLALWVEERTEDAEAWRPPPQTVRRLARTGPDALSPVPAALEWPHHATATDGASTPVLVMAASGGGSRAALLCALTLQHLADSEVQQPGGRKRDDAAPRSSLADHLHAISSVSGGSLATAAYLAARLDGKNSREATSHLDELLADDFIQPVLLGALHPSRSRGQALEDYWGDRLRLGHTLRAVAERWQEMPRADHPPLPIPLFNSTTLDGHAVVLTPLRWTNYATRAETAARDDARLGKWPHGARERLTWIYHRAAVYSLDDLVPGFEPTLGQAVRASANFPFGFPLIQVASPQPLAFSPVKEEATEGSAERVRLTDGGVLSNSGLWTLFRLLSREGDELGELRRRGVILIIVDASKMPEYSGRTTTADLVSTIGDQVPLAANLHQVMIELLRRRLGERLGVRVVGLEETPRNNLYTSWALDSRARARLREASAKSLEQMVQGVRQDWATLADPTATIADTALPMRLPID